MTLPLQLMLTFLVLSAVGLLVLLVAIFNSPVSRVTWYERAAFISFISCLFTTFGTAIWWVWSV